MAKLEILFLHKSCTIQRISLRDLYEIAPCEFTRNAHGLETPKFLNCFLSLEPD